MAGEWWPIREAVRAAAGESLDRAEALRTQLTSGVLLRLPTSRPSGIGASELCRALERVAGAKAHEWAKSRRVVELIGEGDRPLAEGLPWASAVVVRRGTAGRIPAPPWIPVDAAGDRPPELATRAELVVLPSMPDELAWPLALAARSWLKAGGLLWSGCGVSSARTREVLPALGFTRGDRAGDSAQTCWCLKAGPAGSGRRG
ncbi:MAG: hypothetical protein AAGG07_11575 [Planctomycetota bacterium]